MHIGSFKSNNSAGEKKKMFHSLYLVWIPTIGFWFISENISSLMQWNFLKYGVFKGNFIVESPMPDIWATDDSKRASSFSKIFSWSFMALQKLPHHFLSELSWSRSTNIFLLIHVFSGIKKITSTSKEVPISTHAHHFQHCLN